MRKILGALVVAAAVVTGGSASAAESANMWVKVNNAEIKGDSTQKSLGRDGSIECHAVEWSVQIPRDPATGQSTGRKRYTPIRCTKKVDRSSPALFTALTSNQAVSATLRFYGHDREGKETNTYSVIVSDGRVSSIATTFDGVKGLVEVVEFTFSKIVVQYVPSGQSAQDTWQAQP